MGSSARFDCCFGSHFELGPSRPVSVRTVLLSSSSIIIISDAGPSVDLDRRYRTTLLRQTDFEYDPLGTRLAVSDSAGHIHIFGRKGSCLELETCFCAYPSADGSTDSHILSLAWPTHANNLLAVGTFQKRVLVFAQVKSSAWELAFWYDCHEGPVSRVQWAQHQRLYACSSDGHVSVHEPLKGKWSSARVRAHLGAAVDLALRPKGLLQPK